MSEISLAAPVNIDVNGGGGPLIAENHLVALILEPEGIRIDTSRFHSRDVRKDREGILRVRINRQETLFPYTGSGEVFPKFRDKLLYLGAAPEELALDLNLVELDEKEREALGSAAGLLNLLGGSPLGAFNPAVSAGLALGSSLLRFAQSQIDDDEEAQVFVVHRDRLKDGQKLSLDLRSKGSADSRLRLSLRVLDLGPIDAPARLRIRVGNPVLDLESRPIRVRQSNTGPGVRRPVVTRDVDAQDWLLRSDMELFNFEARSLKAAAAYTTNLATIDRVLSWHVHDVLETTGGAGAGRHVLPLTMSFSLNNKDLNAEALLEVARSALDLAAAFEPRAEKAHDLLKKHGPTALSFISELTSKNFSLFGFDGVVVLDAAGGGGIPDGEGRLVLPRTDKGTWSRRIQRELTWRGDKVGSFAFDLEAKSAG